jgi:hypothetical protein
MLKIRMSRGEQKKDHFIKLSLPILENREMVDLLRKLVFSIRYCLKKKKKDLTLILRELSTGYHKVLNHLIV